MKGAIFSKEQKLGCFCAIRFLFYEMSLK